jgi:hypothetical protein
MMLEAVILRASHSVQVLILLVTILNAGCYCVANYKLVSQDRLQDRQGSDDKQCVN